MTSGSRSKSVCFRAQMVTPTRLDQYTIFHTDRYELDLFGIMEEAGPGLSYWYPRGDILREQIIALADIGAGKERMWH